jgi:Transglutaminase-like superfamily
MEDPQKYYQAQSPMTAIGSGGSAIGAIRKDVAASCELVQGVLIHSDIGPWLYDVKLSPQQQEDKHIRPLTEMLARIRAIDGKPLTAAREPGRRMPSVCRHFSVMLCGLLREQGIPARARCGFGAYFNRGKFEDHWVAEYWNAVQSRWILVDAQMDSVQRKALNLDFDPLDVPHDRFIIAGDAWQMCRQHGVDPSRFGLTHVGLQGLWFIAGNVLRDFASLNRMEMLPWDVWGLMPKDDASLLEVDKSKIDKVAALTLAGDAAFPEIRALYESDATLRVPSVVLNVLHNAPEEVAVR